ncbi:MAG: hypothetical protein AUH85_11575 [Chloroflexi bacterium 13_1_40CM_4_68_4]|nr:MAG: hypothetical protein AUH85_11575 [Chloroflexi bacterium 13_1_40CM_4_68_4]
MQVIVRDQDGIARRTSGSTTLDVPDRITLRDLISLRVREEVARYNLRPSVVFRGMVQPADAEPVDGAYRLKHVRPLDWQKQARIAHESFEHNGFFVLVGERQIGSLDEVLVVEPSTEIAFVRLVPLVGG